MTLITATAASEGRKKDTSIIVINTRLPCGPLDQNMTNYAEFGDMLMAKRSSVQHNHLTISVTRVKSSVTFGLNHDIYEKRYRHGGTRVYSWYTHLALHGVCVYPEERLATNFRLDIFDRDEHQTGFNATLDSYHVRGSDNARLYRKRHGTEEAVYEPPNSIGYLEKIRGENAWAGSVFVTNSTASNILSMSQCQQKLYLNIHEMKEGRNRRIFSISVENHDPDDY